MPTFGPWTSLKSDGSIPDSALPASEWQLRWSMIWTLYDTSQLTYAGRWTWAIAQAGETYFSSTVRVSALAVFAGPLGLIAWIPEVVGVTTTIPQPPPILGVNPPPGGGWSQNAQNLWVNHAEDGDLVWDPSATVGAGGGLDVDVGMDYESAVYQIPLSSGARLQVPFHNVAAGWLIRYANIQIRTVAGGDFAALWRRHDNTYRLAMPGSAGIAYTVAGDLRPLQVSVSAQVANPYSTAAAPGNPLVDATLATGQKPVLIRMPRRVAMVYQGTGSKAFWTQTWDDGLTWEAPVQVWDGQYCAVIAAGAGGSRLIIVGVKANATVVAHAFFELDPATGIAFPRVTEEITPTLTTFAPDGTATVGAMPVLPTNLQWAHFENGVIRLLVNRVGGLHYYESNDEGRTWQG